MGPGKALELLIKSVLLHIGFAEVRSDNRYIFDGTAGQMIQGLGDAHNADVLLEPPVQTPFYTPTRLLIECKDYCYPVSLNVLRSALGLREDINHFEIVDEEELRVRRQNRRAGIVHNHQRYLYQVAVASTSGFSGPAQNFALSHRIPLIEVNKMPFWEEFYAVARRTYKCTAEMEYHTMMADDRQLRDVIYEIASKSAVAITNTGQMLFLYRISGGETDFDDMYSLYWNSPDEPWTLRSGQETYQFQLPKHILQHWLESSATDFERRINAINCKANFFSNMVVYYSDEYGHPKLKMISINHYELDDALRNLKR
jgi:hypothetical protein